MVFQHLCIWLLLVSLIITGTALAGEVFLEAEHFDDAGGWKRDQQFVHLMGSSYLLAHGSGEPVSDAITEVDFPETGTYRVWVRTKNWVPGDWKAPGRFKVILNGDPVDTVFGTESGWGWQDGGKVKIESNKVNIRLKDMTGFDGRCDAIYFTTDQDFQPPNEEQALKSWRNQQKGLPEKPPSAGQFDVVVVGGGIAGCGAALAADKAGLNVALIHDRPVLGGNASSEIRVHAEGISGKSKDLLKDIDTRHYPNGSSEARKDTQSRHETMQKSGVNMFLSWRAYGVKTDCNSIESVDARNLRNQEIKRFHAPVFIDCTGDGWIGYWAQADYTYGREARSTYVNEGWSKHGELWSPKKADNMVMGPSLLWNSEKAGEPVSFPEVPWAMPVVGDKGALEGGWEWEYIRKDRHQIKDAEYIRDYLLRAIYGSFYNAKQNPENANRKLKWVGYIAGKRESRRLMGDYVYTQQDALSNHFFKDTVAMERRHIDVHVPAGDFKTKALFRNPGGNYYIPFRTLYSRNISNLMMAGRCFSCSHIGLGGPRVMRTTGQMGVATGYAAALCVKHDTTPRGVYKKHIDQLQSMIGYSEDTERMKSGEKEIQLVKDIDPDSMTRCAGQYEIVEMPERFAGLAAATIPRGNSSEPSPEFEFAVNKPVTVYLLVHDRGNIALQQWAKTDLSVEWRVNGDRHADNVYKRDFPAGEITIPGHDGKSGGYYGVPNMAVVEAKDSNQGKLTISGNATE